MRALERREPLGRESFRMGPGVIALAYFVKYVALTGYGVHAAIVEVPSFVDVGGSTFALVWALIVVTFSSLTGAAVARTWFTNRKRYEKWATAGLVLAFMAYSVVLLVRGLLENNWDGVSLAWLPAALCVFPLLRYWWLVANR